MAADILQRIIARKREEIIASRRRCSENDWLERGLSQPAKRGFVDAVAQPARSGGVAIIAEVKRASPSKGVLLPAGVPFLPEGIAAGYATAGAACISCLTDRDFFQGDLDFIPLIRASVPLPVLRKDFLVDPYQVAEARGVGADAILLIMAALSPAQAGELLDAATRYGLDVLMEVHDRPEMEQALTLPIPLIGINNRNLSTFHTSLETTVALAPLAGGERILVSESGIASPGDIRFLQGHGVSAFLIGEAFMRHAVPGQALATFLGGLSEGEKA
ncbi:MAG: indole-3-glycerol phosphate synthase TrpC [Magnetococcales bacterium]|nr:indole-3-glycerol phosphate synthase TrpC [Magnetococcales bacterium]